MTLEGREGLVLRAGLTEREVAAAHQLLDACNRYEGLDLKVALDVATADANGTVNHILYYAGGALAGYCQLDGEREVELCGMVEPTWRRRGIGRALLQAAASECRKRGARRVLLICEDASSSGQAFVSSLGLHQDNAEYRMELEALRKRPERDERLAIQRAGAADVGVLARITASAFGSPEEETARAIARNIARDMNDPHQRFYVARLGETAVGSLKVYVADDRASIYGFGVLPEYRGRGLGRQLLTWTVETLQAEGWHRIGLEVDTDNEGALALYRSCGFIVTTTYGYYPLPI